MLCQNDFPNNPVTCTHQKSDSLIVANQNKRSTTATMLILGSVFYFEFRHINLYWYVKTTYSFSCSELTSPALKREACSAGASTCGDQNYSAGNAD